MRYVRPVLASGCLLLSFVVWKHAISVAPVGSRHHRAPTTAIGPGSQSDAIAAESARTTEAQRREVLTRHAYAQRWDSATAAELVAFREWTARYLHATESERAKLESQGVVLARARRSVMRAMIVERPRDALAVAVPMAVRRELPEAVIAELERRIAGRGELMLVGRTPAAGEPVTGPSLRRRALLGGQTYNAHVYGRREPQTSLAPVSLHGVVIDRELALHESPLRALEPDEFIAADANATCPVSDRATAPIVTGATAGNTGLALAAVDGRLVEFCDTGADMLIAYARQLEASEDARDRGLGTPPVAAEATTPWTVGTKQVLVIRVDFSDVPGEPIAQQTAASVINTGVRPYYEDASYGLTSLVATVSDNVYRLPQTANAYAINDNEAQLHTDARNAASAHYTLANYDRIVVVFANIGTSRFPNSQITFGGEGSINSANVWINGSASFSNATVAHELGHTYGLLHANLWRINDGNPISAAGNSLEYGDPFDMMGSTSATGVSRDPRHHFNMWSKNRLGWLPDGAVTTVTTSGTYRIYRFDSKDAARTQPLALRIFRDGVRWYWVGLRQNFATGTPQSNGAYVIWGFNNRQQSQLLDFTTPGSSANDAAIPLGTEFSDTNFGIRIKPVARGGTDPAQYLDVEVTVSPVASNVVASWGREGALFWAGNTGAPPTVNPETNVPMDLTNVQAIAGGDQHVVALKGDGSVIAWGDHEAGQLVIPAGLGNVASVAAGGDTSGVVKRDGTVQLWGLNASGQAAPPSGLGDVRQLAIGRNHALALKNDGTVVAWGANNQGQTTVPAGLNDVVAITAGAEFSVALRRDGTVLSWGSTFGRPPAGTSGIAAISACGALNGGQFVAALKTDGTVVAWGANNSNQTNVPSGLSNVVAIAAGAFHTLALKSDGTIATWGSGSALTVPRDLPRPRAIAATNASAFAIIGSSIFITTQPQDRTIAVGGSASLNVAATGSGVVTYQWRKDGVAVGGATNATLSFNSAAASDSGVYDVVIRDANTSVTTNAARFTVAAAVQEVSRISNLSIRTSAGTGAQTLIVGFVIGGSGTTGTKPLLVRGVGPTLGAFGVTGVLNDPKVELYSSSAVKLFENDNWNPADAATFTSVGAFALNPSSRDAALYNGALPSAGYSAQFSGVGNASGIVLAEIYDVMPGATFGATTPRLVNVSARATSGTGADVLIAGFVIAGPTSKSVLIRAIGPTLSVFGVAGALADPKLELFNSAGVKVDENDNWGGTTTLVSAFNAVGAFQLVGDSRDAALLARLQPGGYTAQVSGVGGRTGVALVEIYEAP